jgi:hypothetical protein
MNILDIIKSQSALIMVLSIIMVVTWIIFVFSGQQYNKNDKDFATTLQKRDRYILFMLAIIQITLLTFSNQLNFVIDYYDNQKSENISSIASEVNVKAEPIEVQTKQNPQEQIIDKSQLSITNQGSKVPFSDIIEFNETNSKQQAYIDLLKQRYESWLVTYYYLQKCGKVQISDFELIKESLKKDLEAIKADINIINNINISANGSYKEMYSDIPCDEARISGTKANYDSSMKQLKK